MVYGLILKRIEYTSIVCQMLTGIIRKGLFCLSSVATKAPWCFCYSLTHLLVVICHLLLVAVKGPPVGSTCNVFCFPWDSLPWLACDAEKFNWNSKQISAEFVCAVSRVTVLHVSSEFVMWPAARLLLRGTSPRAGERSSRSVPCLAFTVFSTGSYLKVAASPLT